jgi:hypothetical protein
MKNIKHNQAGVTLLLGLLIMGSLLAISLSIAAILLIEIKNSGDLSLTEAAYQGSLAVGEEKLFEYKRNIPAIYASQTSTLGSKVKVDPPVVSSTSSPIIQLRIPKEDTSFSSATTKIYIYDANNERAGSGYGLIKLTYLNTSATQNLVVYIWEFDPSHGPYSPPTPATSACQSSNINYEYWLGQQTMSPGSDFPQTLTSSKQQMIIIYNASTALNDAYVQIQSYADTIGTVPKGLPYAGYKTINVNSKNSGINRKLQFTIPK